MSFIFLKLIAIDISFELISFVRAFSDTRGQNKFYEVLCCPS